MNGLVSSTSCFTLISQTEMHLDTKEKPFKCLLCSQAFGRRDLLQRHERKSHGNAPVATEQQSPQPSVLAWNEQSQQSIQQSQPSQQHDLLFPPSEPIQHETWPGNLSDSFLNPPGFEDLWQNGFLPEDITLSNNLRDLLDEQNISQELVQTRQIVRTSGLEDHARTILSRPSSPPLSTGNEESLNTGSVKASRAFEVTEEYRCVLQEQLKSTATYTLPSRVALSRFVTQYFKSFHRHQPFLHEATWDPEQAPVALVLAVCANGALYSLERKTATDLYNIALKHLDLDGQGIHLLQTQMLLIAFAAWGGTIADIEPAMRIQASMTLRLRREEASYNDLANSSTARWDIWRATESFKRYASPHLG